MDYQTVSIEKLTSRKKQVRQEFDQEFMKELAQSIRKEGVLVPIIVRSLGNRFEIIAGEQRWRAAKIAKLKEVPISLVNADDKKASELALIDNVKRKDLQSWEREDAVAEMWKSGRYNTLDDLAGALDIRIPTLKNILEVRAMRRRESLPDGASTTMVTEVAGLDETTRKRILTAQVEGELSKDARRTRELVSALKNAPEKARPGLVEAHAAGEIPLDSLGDFAHVVDDRVELKQLLDTRKTLPERDFKSVVSYLKSEREKGSKPILKTVVKGDIHVWSSYLKSVEGARDELLLLKPSKCSGWPVVEKQKLRKALLELDNQVRKMLDALEVATYER